MSEAQVTQLFSFGYGQKYPNGYIKIHAPDHATARKAMFQRYGEKWAFQYDGDQEDRLKDHCMYLVREITVNEELCDQHDKIPEEQVYD